MVETKYMMTVVVLVVILGAGIGVMLVIQNQIPTTTTTTTTTTSSPSTVLVVNVGNETESFTMAELMSLPSATGEGGHRKSTGTIVGPYNYTGVPLFNLLNEVGTLPVGYTVELVASDDYTTYLTKAQVEGSFDGFTADGNATGIINCTVVLAYHEDGVPLTTGGPLRIVTLNDEGYLTDGHFWAKDVVNITVINEVEPWELQLAGIETWNMTHDEYYSVASCQHHNKELTVGNDTYSGVALWTIVSAMDGADDDHYQFNGTLAAEGYDVIVFDGEGNNVTLTSMTVALNNNIILAGWVGGNLLSTPDAPLKLVNSSGSILFGNVVKIIMVFS